MAANDNHILTVGNLGAVTDVYDARYAATSVATPSAAGLMSAADKSKLDNLGALTLAYDEQGGTSYISLVEEGE